MIRDVTGYQPLVPVVAAVSAGILCDRLWPLPFPAWFFAALVATTIWLIAWLRRWQATGAIVLLAACGSTGAAWHHCCWSLFARDDLGHYASRSLGPVCLEALALKSGVTLPPAPPDPLASLKPGERTRVEVEVLAIRNGLRWETASGTTQLLIDGRRTDIRAGDRLRVFAGLTAPPAAENPGQLDMATYLRRQRRRALLWAKNPEGVQVIQAPGGRQLGAVSKAVDFVRRRNKQCLARYLSPQRTGLAGAVLVGAREELDPEQSAAFLETGTVHLLVVSGLNVGILAGAMWSILRRVPLPRSLSAILLGTVTVAYMILTDAEPPIVRATVLVLGGMLALHTGRRGRPFNTLAAAALVVLALNPLDLFSVGAQLSFLCVAGMVWGVPRMVTNWPRWRTPSADSPALRRLLEQSLTRQERLVRWCLGVVAMSAGLTLVTAPLVAARFHLIAPIAPVLNAVLWLPVFTGTLSGFGLLTLGWIWPLGHLFGWCCDGSMWTMQAVVDLARRVPLGHFWTAGPADWWLAVFYGGLAIGVAWPKLIRSRRAAIGLLAVWVGIGYGFCGFRAGPPALECTFLSVGHGCAAVTRLPDGQVLLYDAGHLGPPRVAARAIEAFLWSHGLSRVDTIVLSHADTDHYNAVPELLDRFSVGQVCVSSTMFAKKTPAIEALRTALERHGLKPRIVGSGDAICRGVEVLHPPEQGVLGHDNANSVVVALEHLGHRILLPGDLDSPGLEELLSKPSRPCEVVLAPHHGSKRSQPGVLADWAQAKWIVVTGDIPGGRDDPPDRDSQGRLLLHTARCGAVTVRIDRTGLTVTGYAVARPRNVQRAPGVKPDGTSALERASKGRLEQSIRGTTGPSGNAVRGTESKD